jgi:hypothetical protein
MEWYDWITTVLMWAALLSIAALAGGFCYG